MLDFLNAMEHIIVKIKHPLLHISKLLHIETSLHSIIYLFDLFFNLFTIPQKIKSCILTWSRSTRYKFLWYFRPIMRHNLEGDSRTLISNLIRKSNQKSYLHTRYASYQQSYQESHRKTHQEPNQESYQEPYQKPSSITQEDSQSMGPNKSKCGFRKEMGIEALLLFS